MRGDRAGYLMPCQTPYLGLFDPLLGPLSAPQVNTLPIEEIKERIKKLPLPENI